MSNLSYLEERRRRTCTLFVLVAIARTDQSRKSEPRFFSLFLVCIKQNELYLSLSLAVSLIPFGWTCDLRVSVRVQWPCRAKDKVSILEHTLGASGLAEISKPDPPVLETRRRRR
jgi:hypothetical protein